MDHPPNCSICQQPLRRVWHEVAHERVYTGHAEIWTCPHNILSENHFGEPRHDEWHQSEHGWIKREY